MKVQIITPKIYSLVFTISMKTACNWHREDCNTNNVNRISEPLFEKLYCFRPSELITKKVTISKIR